MEMYQYKGQRFQAMRFTGSEASAEEVSVWANQGFSEQNLIASFISADGDASLSIDNQVVPVESYILKTQQGNFSIVARDIIKKEYRRITGVTWPD